MSAWTDHVEKWKDCTKCDLCKQRYLICLARGTIPCDVLFVGEAPGNVENDVGQPFRGPAGRLLDQMIERAIPPNMGLTHAMTNLVCCFPAEAKAAGTNEPASTEILACRARLIEFVNIARPRLIVCVGALSTRYVDHGDCIPVVDIVHPARILAHMSPAQKPGAISRQIVIIRQAVEDIDTAGPKEWREWGTRYAGVKTNKEHIRSEYDRISPIQLGFNFTEPPNVDDIPF